MKKTQSIIVLSKLLLICASCFASNADVNNYSSIYESLPCDMRFKTDPTSLEGATSRSSIDQAIKDEEVSCTLKWLEKALKKEVLNYVEKENILLYSNVGSKKDDAVALSWKYEKSTVTVLDSRSLVILITLPVDSIETVQETFEKISAYDQPFNKQKASVSLKESGNSESGSWGIIYVDKGTSTGWFSNPIEWHKSGRNISFLFDKELSFAKSKVLSVNPSMIYGGADKNTEVPFLRFENNNRQFHAKEQSVNSLMHHTDVDSTKRQNTLKSNLYRAKE